MKTQKQSSSELSASSSVTLLGCIWEALVFVFTGGDKNVTGDDKENDAGNAAAQNHFRQLQHVKGP